MTVYQLHMEQAADVSFSEVHHETIGTIGIVEYKDKEGMEDAAQKLHFSEFINQYWRGYINVKQHNGEYSPPYPRAASPSPSPSPSTSPRHDHGYPRHRSKSPRARNGSASRFRLRSNSPSASRSNNQS
ncbi:serine/arginine-rich-splicing factor SR34-like isoform X2 [Brachypodium distachyon]|uniref:serine/arginine-rich-splicing factor SR34-like isoform X2 n=1 Tax=Brachypodium distachyon TaxID=15368 RepID=UPI000D0DF914|nr:serine/arginine-rich-splicing factor SR34-like isoform X2 [Brachypodium distachyon]|eukprot:XP_024311434.1 serine/arginine-rich-splicing factor SR34-like isoform X2 [Brachypodium distachyon]